MAQINAPQTQNSVTASLTLVFGCVVFGLGSLIVAHLPLGAYAMAFWRLLVAGIIFAALSRILSQSYPAARGARNFALFSGVFLGVDLALWHESIYAVGPGISTLLNSLQIFFLAAIGYVFFAERQSRVQLLSLVIAIIGVAMIGSPEFAHNIKATWGFVSGVVSGSMLACSMALIRKTHDIEPVPILPLMTLISVGGCLAMLLPMLWLDAGKMLPTTLAHVGWIFVYGAVMQCFAWGMIAYSIPKLSLALTGLLLLSEPVAALVIDYVWLSKPINMLQWVGAALTMLAIFLGSLKPQETT